MNVAEFTGERYLPSVTGPIALEHKHRYEFASRYAAGKRVLDVACGEGYGTAMLASVAASVCGVDIDAAATDGARNRYRLENVSFISGSTSKLPFADATFGLVVSFETLEHVDEQSEMLSEIVRVLEPGGIFIISTPNKAVYSDEPGYSNPFHKHELQVAEFRELLTRHFRHTVMYGQQIATVSTIVHECEPGRETWNGTSARPPRDHLQRSTYAIAVCGAPTGDAAFPSMYVDFGERDPLADIRRTLRQRDREFVELQEAYRRLETAYRNVLDARAVALPVSRGLPRGKATYLPLPGLEDSTLDEDLSALRLWTKRCAYAREASQIERTASMSHD